MNSCSLQQKIINSEIQHLIILSVFTLCGGDDDHNYNYYNISGGEVMTFNLPFCNITTNVEDDLTFMIKSDDTQY